MVTYRRQGRIRVKAVIILVVVVLLLGVGAIVARNVRRTILAKNALAASKVALSNQDWKEACKQLNRYLNRRPDDLEMLEAYASANLKVRPQEAKYFGAAIGAYRLLLRDRPGDKELSRKLARLYNLSGNFSEAAYICKQRLEVAPADADAMMRLGEALFRSRDMDAATEVLSEVVELDPTRVKAFALLAALALDQGGLLGRERAREWLDDAIATNPESPTAFLQRSLFHRKVAKDLASAKSDLRRADTGSVSDSLELLTIADEWMAHGEYDRSQKAIDQAAALGAPGTDDLVLDTSGFAIATFLAAGKLALLTRDVEGAVRLADDAVESLPSDRGNVFLPLAIDLFFAAGRVDAAKAATDKLREFVADSKVTEGPAVHALALADATIATSEGRPYDVIESLSKFLETNPKSAQGWRLIRGAFEQTRQRRRALSALEDYLDLVPDDFEALLAAARSHRNQNWAKTARYALRAEAARPNSPAATALRIEAQLRLLGRDTGGDDFARLSGELDELAKAHPEDLAALMLRSSVLVKSVGAAEAEAALRRALTGSDQPVRAALAMAEFLSANGKVKQAIEACEEAIVAHPEAIQLRLRLSSLHLADGSTADARRILEDAISDFQGDDRALAEYAYVSFLVGQNRREAAIERLKQVAKDHPNDARPRVALLSLEEVASDLPVARQLVDEIKGIEGEGGVRWRFEDVRLRLRGENWRTEEAAIEQALLYCLREDPDWSSPAMLLGRLYEALDRPVEAERVYRTAQTTSPKNLVVATRLLSLLERQGRFAEAESILGQLPVDADILSSHRIVTALGSGEGGTAIEVLERRIQPGSQDAAAMVLLARIIFAQTKDSDRAIELLDRAESISAELPTIYSTRALILRSTGRDEEALALINARVDKVGDYASYLLRAGFHEAGGNLKLAEKDYAQLPELDRSDPRGDLALGVFLYRRGRLDDAIAAWRKGLVSHPQESRLQMQLVKALVTHPTEPIRKEGEVLLRSLMDDAPNDATLLLVFAETDLAKGNEIAIRRAEQTLERAIAIDPKLDAAHSELIRLSRRRGDLDAAQERVRTAMGSNPRSPSIILAHAALEFDRGNLRLAEDLAHSVLDIDRRNIDAGLMLAGIALRAGRREPAKNYIDQILAFYPRHARAVVANAEILIVSGQRDDAIKSLTDYCEAERGKSSISARLALAGIYGEKEDFAAASDQLRFAQELSPGNVNVAVAKINLLSLQGRVADVAAAASIESSKEQPRLELVVTSAWALGAASESGYKEQAIGLFRLAITLAPRRSDLHLGLAQVLYQVGDHTAAADAYRSVLLQKPFHMQALNDLSWILGTELNQAEEALELATKGLTAYPNNSHLLDTRGVVYFEDGNFSASRADLEACINQTETTAPTRARALLHLAHTLVASDELSLAGESLERARQIDISEKVFTAQEQEEISDLMKSVSP